MTKLRTLFEDNIITDQTLLKIDTGAEILRGHWHNARILELMDRMVESYKVTDDGIMVIILV